MQKDPASLSQITKGGDKSRPIFLFGQIRGPDACSGNCRMSESGSGEGCCDCGVIVAAACLRQAASCLSRAPRSRRVPVAKGLPEFFQAGWQCDSASSCLSHLCLL
eukprot:TRINITY_DN21664_c0_g1_i2.p1 TRINITY_DN21664_c0_g1~~TRINITY_DN21664_c0_g1_i2.p1  ORF type:complete len:117 (+),score=7.72 TRINITY_DN21664_c0_g1_i2:34-351(+)